MKRLNLSVLLLCVACGGAPEPEPGLGEIPPEDTALTVLYDEKNDSFGPSLTVIEPPFVDGTPTTLEPLNISAVGADYRGQELLILGNGERQGEVYAHALYSRADGALTKVDSLELPFAASGFSASGELIALTDAPGKVVVTYNLTSGQIEQTTTLDEHTVAIDMLGSTLYGVSEAGVTLRPVNAPANVIRTIALTNSRVTPRDVRGVEVISENLIYMMDSNPAGAQLLRLEVESSTDARVAGYSDLLNIRGLTAAP